MRRPFLAAAFAFALFAGAAACQSSSEAPAASPQAADGGPVPDAGGGVISDGGPGDVPEPGDAGQIPGDTRAAVPCTGAKSAGQAVLCVDARSASAPPDGSAARPFTSVQAAIDAAKAGDVVQVAAGTYHENVRVAGKAVELVGGFEADFTKRDATANATILEGAGGDAVVHLANAGASVVQGFRIRGGTGHPDGDRFSGGGVFCEGGKPTIAFNVIEANDIRHDRTMARGGGLNADNSEARILHNVITGNFAMRGAGIAVSGNSKIVIEGNVISDNVAIDDHGGGVFASGADIAFRDNLVTGNEIGRGLEYGWGGGVYIHSKGTVARLSGNVYTKNLAPSIGSAVFIDNEATAYLAHELLYKNRCPERGGALYVDGLDESGDTGSTVFVDFSTIADNECPLRDGIGAGAVYVEGDSKLTIANSILWGHRKDIYVDDRPGTSVALKYTLTSEATASSSSDGNFSKDPLFVDAPRGDYHVRSKAGHFDPATGAFVKDDVDSPTLDVADPASDFSREHAPNGGRANLGVYGDTAQASLSGG